MKMCEWYDLTERGVLQSGRNDPPENQILDMTLRWASDGWEIGADEKRQQALLRGRGLHGGPNATKSLKQSAAEPQELRQGSSGVWQQR